MLFGFVMFISKIMILAGVFGFIFNWVRGGIDEGARVIRFLPNKIHSAKLIGAVLVGMFIASLNSVFFYSEPGMSYLVQYPWGVQKGVLTQAFTRAFLVR